MLASIHQSICGNKTYCALVCNDVVVVVVLKVLIKHTVQTSCLVLVPVHAVLDLLRCISREVVRLTLPVDCRVSNPPELTDALILT